MKRASIFLLAVGMIFMIVGCGPANGTSGQTTSRSSELTGSGDDEHPPADGPVRTVAEGRFDGWDWALEAYRSEDGLCVDLRLGSNSGGSCGSGRRGALRIAGIGWGNDLPDWQQVHGQVSRKVDSLKARYGGEGHKLPLYRSNYFDRTFFVAFVPVDTGGLLIARDDQQVLAKKRIPPGDF